MPDFNISDAILLLPAVIGNIYFWPRWYRKFRAFAAPTSIMEQGNKLRDAIALIVWIFGIILLFLAIYLPLTFVVYRYLPAPLLFG